MDDAVRVRSGDETTSGKRRMYHHPRFPIRNTPFFTSRRAPTRSSARRRPPSLRAPRPTATHAGASAKDHLAGLDKAQRPRWTIVEGRRRPAARAALASPSDVLMAMRARQAVQHSVQVRARAAPVGDLAREHLGVTRADALLHVHQAARGARRWDSPAAWLLDRARGRPSHKTLASSFLSMALDCSVLSIWGGLVPVDTLCVINRRDEGGGALQHVTFRDSKARSRAADARKPPRGARRRGRGRPELGARPDLEHWVHENGRRTGCPSSRRSSTSRRWSSNCSSSCARRDKRARYKDLRQPRRGRRGRRSTPGAKKAKADAGLLLAGLDRRTTSRASPYVAVARVRHRRCTSPGAEVLK